MFSGIVSSAVVERVEKTGKDIRLSLNLGPFAGDVQVGDSVAVNGVCLTVVECGPPAVFDVMAETVKRTNLEVLKPNTTVNVELSLRAGDRIGGHLILGHVDGTGTLVSRKQEGDAVRLWIAASPMLTVQMVPKGAVALDGVSMTLVNVERNRFSVAVIPHTLTITTLGRKIKGDSLNIEADMMGKYVRKYVNEMSSK